MKILQFPFSSSFPFSLTLLLSLNLKLYSCAEASLNENPSDNVTLPLNQPPDTATLSLNQPPDNATLPWDKLSPEILHCVGDYLVNPYTSLGWLNNHCRTAMSTFPLKRFIHYRFNIPELVTEDVASDEPELKSLFSLLKFSADPNHVYQALKNEFFNETNFFNLLPNLMNYLQRYEAENSGNSETNADSGNDVAINIYIKKMVQRKKFDYFFNDDASLFYQHAKQIFSSTVSIQDLIEYIHKTNPAHFKHIRNYFASMPSDEIFQIVAWMMADFASRSPTNLIFDYPIHIINALLYR